MIKFRAWDLINRMMRHVSFIEFDAAGEICNITLLAPPEDTKNGHYARFEERENGNNLILMQFTGLHDKNGREAFGQDVVRVYDQNRYCICDEWEDCEGDGTSQHRNHGEHKHEAYEDCEKFLCTQEIKLSRQGGYFCNEDTGEFCPPLGAEEIELEIIGNIYGNPELLQSKEIV